MKKPIDFFCIGSAKSGTTWLFDKLKDHPQLFIPKEKEIHYFNTYTPEYQNIDNPNLKSGESYLEKKFQDADDRKLWGDFSTSYLNDEKSANRISVHNQKAKIICILRQPVERAYSHFLFLQQRGFIKPMSFENAIEYRPDILSKGLYYKQLMPFYKTFGKENIQIFLFEDISRNPSWVLNSIEQFLDIDKVEYNDIEVPVNASKKLRFPIINEIVIDINNKLNQIFIRRLSNKVFALNSKAIEEDLSPTLNSLKSKYNDYFEKDVEQLSSLFEFKQTKWLD